MSAPLPADAPDMVVLAGGLGTRIRSVLGDTPKLLAPVGGHPLLAWLLAELGAAGFERVILALGHGAGAVEAWLAARELAAREPVAREPALRQPATHAPVLLQVLTSREPAPRGTGGALRHALPALGSRTVAVMNGDTLIRVDWARFLAFHRERGARVSLAVATVPDASRFGTVEATPDGRVTGFAEKREGARGPAEVSSGCYLIEREELALLPEDRPLSLERDVLPQLTGAGLFACRCVESFLDIGVPESLAGAGGYLARVGWPSPGRADG